LNCSFRYIAWFWYLSRAVIRGHLPLTSSRVINCQLARGFLLSLVSMLSHSLRPLGVFRMGKFLILGSMYPRRLSATENHAEFDCQGCDHFSTFFRASKNPTFLWARIWLIYFYFLITAHRSLFALWLPLQFSHF
jgi:hypothetical protein